MKKTYMLTACFIGCSTVALAQEVTLKVMPNELNVIGQGLEAQQQAIQALTAKLRQQYIDQQPKPAEAPVTAPNPVPVPTPAPLPKQ